MLFFGPSFGKRLTNLTEKMGLLTPYTLTFITTTAASYLKLKMKYKYDAYREEVDVGCKYAENCFKCPFSDCIASSREVDDAEGDYSLERSIILERAKYVKRLKDGGMKTLDIANKLNCEIKTVRRDIIIAQEEEKRVAEQNGHQES